MAHLPSRRGSLGFPFDLMTLPWQTAFGQNVRVEDFIDGDVYVLRAELPGLDAEHDLRVHVADGALRIHAERGTDQKENAHSEFHYGTITRTIALPVGAKEDTASATYRNGILEVRVELAQSSTRGHDVPVKVM